MRWSTQLGIREDTGGRKSQTWKVGAMNSLHVFGEAEMLADELQVSIATYN